MSGELRALNSLFKEVPALASYRWIVKEKVQRVSPQEKLETALNFRDQCKTKIQAKNSGPETAARLSQFVPTPVAKTESVEPGAEGEFLWQAVAAALVKSHLDFLGIKPTASPLGSNSKSLEPVIASAPLQKLPEVEVAQTTTTQDHREEDVEMSQVEDFMDPTTRLCCKRAKEAEMSFLGSYLAWEVLKISGAHCLLCGKTAQTHLTSDWSQSFYWSIDNLWNAFCNESLYLWTEITRHHKVDKHKKKARRILAYASVDLSQGARIDVFEVLPCFRGQGQGRAFAQALVKKLLKGQAVAPIKVQALETAAAQSFWKKMALELPGQLEILEN